jgi:hypothetical protein
MIYIYDSYLFIVLDCLNRCPILRFDTRFDYLANLKNLLHDPCRRPDAYLQDPHTPHWQATRKASWQGGVRTQHFSEPAFDDWKLKSYQGPLLRLASHIGPPSC